MEVLKKLTKKNLTLNKKRTIVTIIGIMLSVALITAVSGVYMSGLESLKAYEISVKGNYHYVISNVDSEKHDYIENNRKVEDSYSMKDVGYGTIEGYSEDSLDDVVGVREIDKDAIKNLCMKVIKGRLPENEDEILINDFIGDFTDESDNNIHVGEKIVINLGKKADVEEEEDIDKLILDKTKKTYTVVGVCEVGVRPVNENEINCNTAYIIPEGGKVTASENETIYSFIKLKSSAIKKDYEVIAGVLGVDAEYVDKALNEEYSSEEEMNKVEKVLTESGCAIDWNQYLVKMDKDPLSFTGLDKIGLIAAILCIFIVITSVYCIKNSFDISITEKIKLFGMLRSVGATKKQIRQNVMYEAFILGIIGIPLGIVLGCIATFILIKVSDMLLNGSYIEEFHMIFKLSPIAIGLAVVLGVVTVFFASLKSAFKASRIMPIDSIRNSGNIKIKKKKLGVPKIISLLFGIGGEISYKNMKRNKRKYRTTTISIVIVTAIFIGLNSIVTVLYKSVNESTEDRQFNIEANAYYDNEEQKKAIEKTFAGLDGIKESMVCDVTQIRALDLKRITKEYRDFYGFSNLSEIKEYSNDWIPVVGINDQAYKEYLERLEIDELDGDAILLENFTIYNYDYEEQKDSVKQVDMFDYKEGETFNAAIQNEYKSIEIEEKDEIPESVDREDEEEYNDYLFEKTKEDVSLKIGKITTKKPKGFNPEETVLIMNMKNYNKLVKNRIKSARVEASFECENANEVEEKIRENLDGYDFYVYNKDKEYRQIKNMLLLVSIFLYGFIIVVSLIGLTNIFNTITTNMQLRKPEFAMLKSVGMTKKEFRRMIRLESIFLGVKSLFFGIIFGNIISYLLYKALKFDRDFGKFKIPYEGICISIIAVFGIITLIMTYSVKTNDKQNIIETIRNENI